MAISVHDATASDHNAFHPAHHLLAELYGELEWARQELENANKALADLEVALNAALYHDTAGSIDATQTVHLERQREIKEAGLRIDALYDLHYIARQRFHRMEHAFEIARQFNLLSVICVNLRNVLLVERPDLRSHPDIREAMHAIAIALHAYCWEAPSDAHDTAIRTALLDFDTLVARLQ